MLIKSRLILFLDHLFLDRYRSRKAVAAIRGIFSPCPATRTVKRCPPRQVLVAPGNQLCSIGHISFYSFSAVINTVANKVLQQVRVFISLVHFFVQRSAKSISHLALIHKASAKFIEHYNQPSPTLYRGSTMPEELILSATKDTACSLPNLNVLRKNFPKNPTTQDVNSLSTALDQLHNNLLKLKTALNLRKSENLMHEYLAKSFHQSHQSSIED